MQQWIDTDLDAIIDKLPPHIAGPLASREDSGELLEVVLDLGREPEARFLQETYLIDSQGATTKEDMEYVIERIGSFGDDNRAGIERTLHRISAIRNRDGVVVGLTLRVGRAVYGTIRIIQDLVLTGQSVLLLGKPGVGKTTMLREVARVLADDAQKRVVIVDTSNEIAGDGDIPHPGIGRARRMQVSSPAHQHAVMIEAVENHMPEVIIIDEIGTELEANAARTIAERGVQLVGTAHGIHMENLILNPTLSDLIGGVHTVTLGDDEARRRRTQKTVQERRGPPTFDILVEIQGWNHVAIHPNVAEVVDRMLRGFPITPEYRTMDADGEVRSRNQSRSTAPAMADNGRGRFESQPDFFGVRRASARRSNEVLSPQTRPKVTRILPYGVNKGKLQQAMRASPAPVELVAAIGDADLLLTTKNFYRRRTQALREAEDGGKPVYVLRKNTAPQIHQFFRTISRNRSGRHSEEDVDMAVKEAEEAAAQIGGGEDHQVDLHPQAAYTRRLQHQIAEEHGLTSSSAGREPSRRVVMYRR